MPASDNSESSRGVNSSNGNGPLSGSTPPPRKKSMSSLAMILLVFGALALPVLFWQSTWFGAELTDEEIRHHLTSPEKPRETQHALAQLNKRIEAGEPNVESFYPLLADLADHERSEIREMAAWVMGGDPRSEALHEALRQMVEDPIPLVRRNAALALSKFADPACRDELLGMLQPYDVPSPDAGTVTRLVKKGLPVRPGMDLATLQPATGPSHAIPSPLGGEVLRVMVADGSVVGKGDILCSLGPAEVDMWEALRALVLVGKPGDAPIIRAALERGAPSGRVAQQAQATLAILDARGAGDRS